LRPVKLGLFATAKLLVGLVQVQHPNYRKGSVSLRPRIDKELDEFLAKERGKSAVILKSRSLARLQ
jgi:hypothetical protein